MDLLVVFLADFVADQVQEIAQPQCRAGLIESQATAVVVIECGRARLKSRIAGLVHDGSLDAFNQYGDGRTVLSSLKTGAITHVSVSGDAGLFMNERFQAFTKLKLAFKSKRSACKSTVFMPDWYWHFMKN